MSPFRLLQQAAAAAGHDLQIESGFRTYEEQRALRAKYLAGTGNKAAEAGRSNHQNGIALDLNTKGFDTAIYAWMKQHAPSYGYIRTVDKEHWHWEYHPPRPPRWPRQASSSGPASTREALERPPDHALLRVRSRPAARRSMR